MLQVVSLLILIQYIDTIWLFKTTSTSTPISDFKRQPVTELLVNFRAANIYIQSIQLIILTSRPCAIIDMTYAKPYWCMNVDHKWINGILFIWKVATLERNRVSLGEFLEMLPTAYRWHLLQIRWLCFLWQLPLRDCANPSRQKEFQAHKCSTAWTKNIM